jgi:ribonuclease III
MAELDNIQEQFGVRFRDERLLKQALTHRSFSQSNNERLEFLGDSVLNLGVAAILYERYPALTEGDLSRVRSNLVKQQALVEIANQLNLSQYMQLGDGELKSGGMRRPSILADTLEALIGAIYLDQGAVAAQSVVAKLYERVLKSVDPNTLGKDAKTLLQEHLQGLKFSLPSYSVVATHGAAHNQVFEVECVVAKLSIQAIGSGGSRRAAEQAAAMKALELVLAASPIAPKRTRSKVSTGAMKAVKE